MNIIVDEKRICNTKPTTPVINFAKIPEVLKPLKQWVVWDYKWKEDKQKWDKPPLCPHSSFGASSTDPTTWGTYDSVVGHYKSGKYSGIGFMLEPSAIKLVAVDIDKCIAPDGTISDFAKTVISELNSYTEISPSGTGIHIWMFSDLPPGRRRNEAIEIYNSGRYLTVTGKHYPGTPTDIQNRQEQVFKLHSEQFPPEPPKEAPAPSTACNEDEATIIERVCRDPKYNALWNGDIAAYDKDQHRADLALVSRIAWACGNDPDRIDSIFRKSGLMRDKWERDDYSNNTIKLGLAKETYSDWKPEPVDRISTPIPTFDLKPEVKRKRTKGILDCDIELLDDPEELVENYINKGTFNCMFGPTGIGKTILFLDMASAMARGGKWLDQFKCEQSTVAYVYSEFAPGLKKRLKAWRMARKQEPVKNLVWYPTRLGLDDMDGEALKNLLEDATLDLGKKPDVIFIDTLAKNMDGDENGSDMSKVVNRCTEFATQNKCTIIVIHHSGKNVTKGARGNSSLKSGVDTEIEISSITDDLIEISNPKARESGKMGAVRVAKQIIQVGFDKKGKPLTSIVWNYQGTVETASEGDKALTKTQAHAHNMILNCLTEEKVTSGEIIKITHISKNTAYEVLARMRALNLIKWEEKPGKLKEFIYWKNDAIPSR